MHYYRYYTILENLTGNHALTHKMKKQTHEIQHPCTP